MRTDPRHRPLALLVATVLVAACAAPSLSSPSESPIAPTMPAGSAATVPPSSTPAPTPSVGTVPAREGLQYDGSIALLHAAAARRNGEAAAWAGTMRANGARTPNAGEARAWVELSAPVWPKVLVLYQQEAEKYPAERDRQVALARDSALTFEQLLAVCGERYDGLTLSTGDGSELTPGQLAANYRIVAQCAYEQFTAKPYWIPQLIVDVDICAEALGAGWRVPGEDDVAALTAGDLAFIERTIDGIRSARGPGESGAPSPGWSWEAAQFYFSLVTWVRTTGGSVGSVDLDPAADHEPVPVSYPAGQITTLPMQSHYEAGWALRCLRTTTLDGTPAPAG